MGMSNTAVQAVLLTPELLEIILLHLDMTALLVSAQRVSRHWVCVIAGSTKLQQALFFKPIASPVKPSLAYSTLPDAGMNSYPNPYSLEIVDSFNPLLEKHFGSVFFNLNGIGNFYRANYFYTNLSWAFSQSGASWRRMLVSQPAPAALGYGWQEYSGRTTISGALITKNPHPAALSLDSVIPGDPGLPQPLPLSQTGLRFGLLYDLLQYHAGHHQYPSLYFRVVWGRACAPRPRYEMKHVCDRLLEDTSVMVQFIHDNDDLDHEPADVDAWDSAFRSEGFQLPAEEEVVYRGLW
ncbi:hypothetical protein BDV33DRAFT_202269 [Aspergillus novoparasiticus]|uniref:F-box domain-containing protein n=1 Tax=Aspergillus novoparasiticus TaxID=986946 RepID=A0A5N6EVA9_9EURO|nr:hypothetical protein BDV33DRAFT_202269 [Aspergillus novoparasiticus]